MLSESWQNEMKLWEDMLSIEEEAEIKIRMDVEKSCSDGNQITQKIKDVQLRLEEGELREKSNTQHIGALKQLLNSKESNMEEQMKVVRDEQKREQEIVKNSNQKSQKMIEQLLQEKEEINKYMKELTAEIERRDQNNIENIKKLRETNYKQLEEQKKMILLQEKKKREEWQKEQVKKIREMTLKGLEPELNSLIQKHQLEMQSAEISFKQKLAETSIKNEQIIKQAVSHASKVFVIKDGNLDSQQINEIKEGMSEEEEGEEQKEGFKRLNSNFKQKEVSQLDNQNLMNNRYQQNISRMGSTFKESEQLSNIFSPQKEFKINQRLQSTLSGNFSQSSNQLLFNPKESQLPSLKRVPNQFNTPHVKKKQFNSKYSMEPFQ